MRPVVFLLAALVIAASGCDDCRERLKPPEPEPEPPQTKEEVLAEIRPVIEPLRNSVRTGAASLPDADREQMMWNLRNAIVAHGDTEYGREALRELGYEIMDVAKRAGMLEHHWLVLTCIDAIELLAMGSHLLDRLGERANVMLERPAVRVRGFLDDHEKSDTYVFLELINRRDGMVERVEARIGDEFHNLRLVDIIGRNRGVRLEYLRVPGLFFDVDAF